jgi:hypothetical protein
LAGRRDRREADDFHRLAPQGLSPLLALEVRSWPATHPVELQRLIRRMARENPSWGEERIANEFLLKLGLRVSPRTVRKYLTTAPSGKPRRDQRWSTFLKNHTAAIIACDFCVVATVSPAVGSVSMFISILLLWPVLRRSGRPQHALL